MAGVNELHQRTIDGLRLSRLLPDGQAHGEAQGPVELEHLNEACTHTTEFSIRFDSSLTARMYCYVLFRHFGLCETHNCIHRLQHLHRAARDSFRAWEGYQDNYHQERTLHSTFGGGILTSFFRHRIDYSDLIDHLTAVTTTSIQLWRDIVYKFCYGTTLDSKTIDASFSFYLHFTHPPTRSRHLRRVLGRDGRQ